MNRNRRRRFERMAGKMMSITSQNWKNRIAHQLCALPGKQLMGIAAYGCPLKLYEKQLVFDMVVLGTGTLCDVCKYGRRCVDCGVSC